MEYRCPYCHEIIEEVSVVELTWKRVLMSAGFGTGLGLLIYPLVSGNAAVAAVGAFIVGFIIVFLLMKGKS